MQKTNVPPSGDKHDYLSIAGYAWPCTATCDEAGFSEEKCKSWDAGLRSFGSCNTSTGLPWVTRDGYLNAEKGDLNTLIVMADTVETLTLAWWFSTRSDESLLFARTAANLVRTWFIDNATRQNPSLHYGGSVPGYLDG